jgi:hypothetical protein
MVAAAKKRGMRLLMASYALAAALLATRAAAAPLAAGAPTVEPARRADAVVVVYRELLGEIGGADRGPTLTVYGDGRTVAHFPVYMTRAGDYEHRLTATELDALLRSLADKGVLDFDGASVRNAVRAAEAAGQARARATGAPVELFEASDASTTVVEVAVDRYVPGAPGARAVDHLSKRVAWTGLQLDAERHRDVAALRDLAAAEQELRALRDRPGYTRVR